MGEKGPSPRTPLFLIGRDSGGHWVVQDDRGLCGGLFVSRNEAMKFALFENGRHPEAIIAVPGFLELEMNRRVGPADQRAIDTEARLAA